MGKKETDKAIKYVFFLAIDCVETPNSWKEVEIKSGERAHLLALLKMHSGQQREAGGGGLACMLMRLSEGPSETVAKAGGGMQIWQ